MVGAADDQMVEDADVEKAQGLLQLGSDGPICRRRFRVARRVVVEEDHGRCVELQRSFGDDPRVDFRAVDGSEEQVLGRQDVVARVKKDRAEDFVRQVSASSDQVVACLARIRDGTLAPEALLQDGGSGEQDPFFVHLELVLSFQVAGALHRFFSTGALCASWEPTGEASGPTAPESEHRQARSEGPQRSAAQWRRLALAIGTAKPGFPSRGPARVERLDAPLVHQLRRGDTA